MSSKKESLEKRAQVKGDHLFSFGGPLALLWGKTLQEEVIYRKCSDYLAVDLCHLCNLKKIGLKEKI